MSIASKSCPSLLDFDSDFFEEISSDLKQYKNIDWEELNSRLGPVGLNQKGCQLFGDLLKRRIFEWAKRADHKLVQPVKSTLRWLQQTPDQTASSFMDRVVTALLSLPFEGGGMHFLQDGFAGGHLRSYRDVDLNYSRFAHSSDNQHGVVATFQTRQQQNTFVAFGDSYLLGPQGTQRVPCQWTELNPQQLSDCLIQRQRGILIATNAASLIDWALSGPTIEPSQTSSPTSPPRRFLTRHLPTTWVSLAGLAPTQSRQQIYSGTLPVPTPPFFYESLLITQGKSGNKQRIGARLEFLSQLGRRANWLTSYEFGLASITSPTTQEMMGEFSYLFHWRWAARFLINLGPTLQLHSSEISDQIDLGPILGVTVLPEGWTKIPLEITISFQKSLLSYHLRGPAIQNKLWFDIALGLAFF